MAFHTHESHLHDEYMQEQNVIRIETEAKPARQFSHAMEISGHYHYLFL